MSDFSRVSNFDPTANYKFVRVGADCPVLEIELNEMQQISEQRLQNLTKTFVGEGVKGSGSYSYEHGVLTITNEEAIVDGVPLKITTLKLNMSEGEKAYIQMWIKEVTYNDTLKYMGNVQESRTVTNKILDTNIGRETSRRMQIQYDLVKDTSQRSDLNPVNLYVGKIEGGKFILDSSLLKTFTNTKNVEKFEVTQDTTQFNTKGAYRVNSNSLQIFVDGVIQLMGYDEDYVEVNSNTFRFNSPVKKGSEVIAIYSNAVVSEERPNTHGSTHNASGDDPIDISDLADRFGVRDKLTKSSDVLAQLGHAIERGEPVAQTIEQGANKIEAENVRMEANIQTAQGVQRELKASCDLAPTKKAELDTSIQEAKHFIENLDGSQNLPQMGEEITTLQNGLKSNQDLAYEGHDLKCENTLDGRIEDIVLEGITYQNLCDKNINVTPDSIYIDNTKNRYLFVAGEYTIKNTSSKKISYGVYSINSNVFIRVITLDKTTKVTLNKDEYIYNIVCHFTENWENTEASKELLKQQSIILKGDYTNKKIPNYFEDIKSVGEAEENKVNILSCGKNLFNPNQKLIKGILYDYIKLPKSNTDYTLSLKDKDTSVDVSNIYFGFTGNGYNADSFAYWLVEKGEVTFNSLTRNVQYISIYPNDEITWKKLNDRFYFQLEEGTQATPFEPYKEDKKEILLPFLDGLKGLPNGVKDIIYNKEDGCYVKQRVKKTIINDKSDIGLYNETVNKKRNRITFVVLHYNKLYNTGIMCDKLPHVFLGDMNATGTIGIDFYTESGWNENNFYITLERDKLGIVENDEKLQIIQKIKNWLKTNPLEVFYELADAIETKISDTKISLDTYNLLTYVFTDNTISPNIKAKVASNIGSIVQQNAKSINDLYKLLEDIIIPQVTQNAYDIALLSAK